MGETFYIANPQQQTYLDPFHMASFEKFPSILQGMSIPERIALLACQFEGSDKLPNHLVWTRELLSSWSSQEIVLWGDYKFEDQVLAMREQYQNLTWPASAMVWEHDLSEAYAALTSSPFSRKNLEGVMALGRSPHLEPFRIADHPSELPPHPQPVSVLQAVTGLLGYPAFCVVNENKHQKIKIFEYRERETVFARQTAEFATTLLAHLVVTLPSEYRNKYKKWFDGLRGSWSQDSLWVRAQPPIEAGDDDYEDITPALPFDLLGFGDLFEIAHQDPVAMRLIGKILCQPHNERFRNGASHQLGCDWRAAYYCALRDLGG